jgi:uncharacterized membrane protein YobD (UPF0266 family)
MPWGFWACLRLFGMMLLAALRLLAFFLFFFRHSFVAFSHGFGVSALSR